jgi:hypothetical protein
MRGPFYVYYSHCYEIVGIEGPLADEDTVDKFVTSILGCGCNRERGYSAIVRVFKGVEVELEAVEKVTHYRLRERA